MQLVELHERIAADEGIALLAISYDPVPVLASFSAKHGIGYPLLSDQGSRVMGELGVLNPLIDEDLAYWGSEKQDKHVGLPYPGVFILDEQGDVVEKRFERSHRNRVSAGVLLEALGRPRGAAVSDEAMRPGLAVTAAVSEESIFPNQIFAIDLSMLVEDGMHVYVRPCPPGYQPLEVTVEAPHGVYWESPVLPEGQELHLPVLGETFSVVDGRFQFPIHAHIHESTGDITLEVLIRFQACDDTTCDLPAEIRLRLPVLLRPKMTS